MMMEDVCTVPADSQRSRRLPSILLEFPISVIQGADLTSFQPARYAVEMERVLR